MFLDLLGSAIGMTLWILFGVQTVKLIATIADYVRR